MISTDEVLSRGVTTILPTKEGLQALMQQRKITLYLGIDPTGNQLHLGHAVVLRKLQQFVELGHHVILLIGNGTVKIGDPTGKDKTRPMLTDEEIEKNFLTWKEQASTILDFSRIEIKRNGDWLDPLTFPQIVKLLATTTVQQLIERDMFQERIKNNQPIFAHEIMYPLLQGYDSVAMDVDLEIGGNDQTFNMMMGRQLLKQMKNKEKWVLGVPLLVGSDGRKMGKSLNNFISLTATPEDMYGKLMSIVDAVIFEYFELLTNVSAQEIAQMKVQVEEGKNPMEIKKKLAWVVTATFHSKEAADQAAQSFEATVQNKEMPAELAVLHMGQEKVNIYDIVLQSKTQESNSQARRVIEQGGVEIDREKITDPFAEIQLSGPKIVKIGKRHFFRVER